MPHAVALLRRSHRRLAALIAAALVSVGCTYDYTRHTSQKILKRTHVMTEYRVERSDTWVLSNNAPVCLVGISGATSVAPMPAGPRAHQRLHKALAGSLAQHFMVLEVPYQQTLLTATQASALLGCSVMIVPFIAHVSDQLNSWEELDLDLGVYEDRGPGADTVVVRVGIYSVVESRPLDIATIHGRTGFWTPTARSPEGMFDAAMRAYVAAISSGYP